MCSDVMQDSFGKLYSQLGFIDEEGNCLPLHKSCGYREKCWSGSYESMDRKPDDQNSAISRPWVGKMYSKLGLLVVGINLNECGGFNALVDLTGQARKELACGAKRVKFENQNYGGSPLWHRVGCYATAFCEAKGICDRGREVDGYPQGEKVEAVYEYIAYTNHVKCSPIGEDSKPSSGMWEHCGHHVLKREISLLKPTDILLLGKTDNPHSFQRAMILDNSLTFEEKSANGLVQWAKCSIDGVPVRMFVVPHPTRGKGVKKEVLSDLRELLKL